MVEPSRSRFSGHWSQSRKARQSLFLSIAGNPGAFVRPNDIIFENNTPACAWVRDGDFGADGDYQ
ncbi:MAG: hypothetical protein VCF25_21065 [Candidatus Poribacteria bacterium]